MSRRPNPARIYIARREATAARLRAVGLPPETIRDWLDAWERREPDRTAAEYWQRRHAWIESEVAIGRKPPTA